MLRISVSTASAEIIENDLITAGRVGLECQFAFSSDWDNLAKTVVIRGTVRRDWSLIGNSMIIPSECLAVEQFPLMIGVYGANANGDIVIPTIWTDFGKIRPSALPKNIGKHELTPSLVAQIELNSATALELAQELIDRANRGEFNGQDGATGPRGPQGDKGDKGDKGDTGATPAFTIGTVTTLAAGNDASASITGTAAAPVLNLSIPKGADGDVSSASMATTFSTSNAYSAGDYVWYSGQLYMFTADHAAGAWTGTDAAAAKLAKNVGDVKSAFESSNNRSIYSAWGWRNAGITGQGIEAPRADRICTDYLSYAVRVQSFNNYRCGIAFYDAEKTWISTISLANNVDVGLNDFPSNAFYIRVILGKDTTIDISEGENCNIQFSTQSIPRFNEALNVLSETSNNLTEHDKIEKVKNTVKFISRTGLFHQGNSLTNMPYDCLVGIQSANDFGYDTVRVNIRMTSDGVAVLSHDATINSVARNTDGTAISGDIDIATHTLAELNQYDYGIRYGSQYAGMKITELSDAMALCKKLGMNVILEIKPDTLTAGEFDSILGDVVDSSMIEYSTIRNHFTTILSGFHTRAPGINIEIGLPSTGTAQQQIAAIDEVITYKNECNKVSAGIAYSGSGTPTIQDGVAEYAQLHGIPMTLASVYDDATMLTYAVSKFTTLELAYVKNPYSVFLASLEE